nr:2-octaprenyl-3-methyl-6-methoxy-1,4-benzoquinol hydroxylase [Klebsiella pneumoniae]
MTIHVTDVAIVGGGMVGGAPALGLAQQGFTVTVLEKAAPPAFDPASAPDVRISAISAASVGLLKSLGVWDAIRAMRVHAYRRLETWEWESAHVAFDAAELKLPELGYMVENKVLQWGLWQALAAHEAVTLRVGSELKTMQRGETQTALHLREGRRSTPGWLSAPTALTPGAGDGRHRRARPQYQQSCMLISVECADDPGDSTGSSLLPTAHAPSCRCSTTGLRWSGTTPRRGSVSCRA